MLCRAVSAINVLSVSSRAYLPVKPWLSERQFVSHKVPLRGSTFVFSNWNSLFLDS